MKRNTMSYKVQQFLMFAGVAAVLFCAVVVIPFVYGIYLTLTSWDGIAKTKPFVGLANYAEAFKDVAYWQALGRTAIYSIFAVVLINVVAFALAYLVTSGIKGQNFFRAGFFVPNLIGGIVLGYVWKFVFNRAFVAIASKIANQQVPSLLSTTSGAMFCLVLVSVWQFAGYMMLIYVAGFMSVSDALKEAAMIDGCTPSQAMWNVTIPLMRASFVQCILARQRHSSSSWYARLSVSRRSTSVRKGRWQHDTERKSRKKEKDHARRYVGRAVDPVYLLCRPLHPGRDQRFQDQGRYHFQSAVAYR